MKKKILLSVFLIVIESTFVFPIKIDPIIEESEIPMPEIQYELPEALIGEFVMVQCDFDIEMTIFSNNKYILALYDFEQLEFDSYGYIVKNNDTFYFSPSPEINYHYFYRLTEIHFTDSGFFFYHEDHGLIRSIRKENMPVPERLADDVSVHDINAKRQYFNLNGSEIDLNKIENIEQLNPVPVSRYHRLLVNNGIVYIFPFLSTNGEWEYLPRMFKGFLETTEESAGVTNGIIRFTNGIPYYYISDGTANIEIYSNGSIMITMLYSPPSEYINKHIREIPELQFPATLVLEF